MNFLLKRLGPFGWALLAGEAVLITRRHVQATSPEDRAEVQSLLKASRGRPGNLTAAERKRLVRTARRLEPGKLAVDLGRGVVLPGRRARRG